MASFKKTQTKAGIVWRVQVAIQGSRESNSFSTKAEAVAWAAERETEIRRGQNLNAPPRKTFEQASTRYVDEVSIHKKGHRWEKIRLGAMCEHAITNLELKIKDAKLGDMYLDEITPAVLGAYRDSRMSGLKKVTGATVNREFNLLSHVFNTARREWKWIAASPTTDVRRPKAAAARDRIPTEDEIARIETALGFDGDPISTKSQAVAVAHRFAIETAMRAGEICALKKDWVVGCVAHLPADITKNGMKRDVPLSKRAIELLDLLPTPEKPAAPLFGITTASLDALFRKARERACVEGLTFHDSRHAAITRLAKKLNVLDLARMVGHKDLRMLQVYYNESAADMAPRLD